jgi:Rps23 Pro-64 3,4-dihydroxylase Tpa1-like proline 4-hydroxylase
VDKLKKELKYLEQKLKEDLHKSRSPKTPREEVPLYQKSILYRQERIAAIRRQLIGQTDEQLKEEAKIGAAFNTPEKSKTARAKNASTAGWNFKKDEYWSK